MNRRLIEKLALGSFLALTGALFFADGAAFKWVHLTWIVLVAGSISYSVSKKSSKDIFALLKNVVVAAVILAAFMFFREGEPSTDEYGYSEGGYSASFEDRAAAAVRIFWKIALGGWIGCLCATELARRENRNEDRKEDS